MFVYSSQSGINFFCKRGNKINVNTKLTKLISGASHPKMIENSTNGCGIYFGPLVYRMIIQTIKKILQIKASLNKIRSLLCLDFTSSMR